MSLHDYTFYVSRRLASKCRCGAFKAPNSMFCQACPDQLPAGDRCRLRKPTKASFSDIPQAYDRAVEVLDKGAA